MKQLQNAWPLFYMCLNLFKNETTKKGTITIE